MERQPITLVLGRIAFEQIRENFEQGKWISWDFPDYTIRLELDPTIEDDGVIHHHDGRRLETQRIMGYTFPHSYLPDDITKLVNLSYSEAVRCLEAGCHLRQSPFVVGRSKPCLAPFTKKLSVSIHQRKVKNPE